MDEAHAVVIDAETVALERPRDHKAELRLWLRLLTCTTMVEDEVRSRLRRQFDVTLPRFDLMAQLHKTSGGMTLTELSNRMMVSNGNLTSLVDRMVEAGQISRAVASQDRRVVKVALTATGEAAFAAMAARHEDWIATFFADLAPGDIETLMGLLGKLKTSTRGAIAASETGP
jgi:DNA-binding MarR family transcriptional regulator